MMKRFATYFCLVLSFALTACNKNKNSDEKSNIINFTTSADYPPLEYYENGNIVGFDIDLGNLVAKELGKKAIFKDMPFAAILGALHSKQVDGAISTIAITKERKKNFDCSQPYYFDTLATVFRKDNPIKNKSQLSGKKIACQIGTTMEIWLKKNFNDAEIITFDTPPQAIESLKSKQVDVVLVDGTQAKFFSKKNPQLSYSVIGKSDDGYGIILPKNSHLTDKINQALDKLQKNGEIKKLEDKWMPSQ